MYGIQGSGAHAVVGGDPDHVHLVDAARAQPIRQTVAVSPTLESAVGRGELPFVKDRFHCAGVQFGVELRARSSGHTVPRPGVDEVRFIGEMDARVDVVVGGRHHVVIAVRAGQQPGNGMGHGGSAGDRQRAAFTEIVLDIDDDQRAHTAQTRARDRFITSTVTRFV